MFYKQKSDNTADKDGREFYNISYHSLFLG